MLPMIAEVRDRTLTRVGILADEDLVGLKLFPARNDVGTWSLELPHMVRAEDGRWVRHTAAETLSQPGAGIVVQLPGGRRFSGPVVSPSFEESTALSRGKWTFSGVSDAVVLADRVAFPDPTIADPQASSAARAYDTRNAPAETLMHGYVSDNIGPTSTTSRRDPRIVMAPNPGRGASRPKSARFPTLLELCQELARPDDLLFDVVQEGDALRFVTWTPADLTAVVRMDVQGDTLDSAGYAFSGPAASRVIVMGQGEATDRIIRTKTTAAAAALESSWARVIETVVDQRGTDEVAELDAKADEVLSANAVQITSLRVEPTDANVRALGTEWWIGDHVTVTVAGVPVRASVASVRVEVTADGLVAGATIGDAVGFDVDRATSARVGGVESRVSSLERTAEGAGARTDWGSKGGPLEHVGDSSGPYAVTWGRGIDSGGCIDAKSHPRRIIVKETGIYEIEARQRGNGNPVGGYIGIGLLGSRTVLESRPEGMWDHDHSASNNNFSTSHYIGLLYAGEQVTMGAEAGQGAAMLYGSSTHLGTLTVRRIS